MTKKKNVKCLKSSSVNIQLENEIDLTEKDFSTQSDGIRLFPYERGNWAISIYSFVNCSSHLDTMTDDLIEIFDNQRKRLTELHISL